MITSRERIPQVRTSSKGRLDKLEALQFHPFPQLFGQIKIDMRAKPASEFKNRRKCGYWLCRTLVFCVCCLKKSAVGPDAVTVPD